MTVTAKQTTQPGYTRFVLRMGIVLFLIKSIESGPAGMMALFTTYLPEMYGWSAASVAFPQSLANILGIPIMLLGGVILEQTKNNKAVLVWTNAIFAVCILFQGITSSYTVYLVAYTAGQIVVRVMTLALFDLVAKWFITTRGRVMGFITVPIIAILWTNVMTRCCAAFGMVRAFWGAFCCMVLVTVLTALFVKGRPSDANFAPDGVERSEAELASMVQEDVSNEWPLKRLICTSEAWGLTLTLGIMTFSMMGFTNFVIPAFMEQGYSLMEAANMMAIAPMIGIPISIAYGWLDDKIGNRPAYRVLMVNFVLMNFCMAYANMTGNQVFGVIALVLMGAVIGGQPNFAQTTMAWVFGGVQFTHASKWIMAGQFLIAAPASVLFGALYDSTGSYVMGFTISGVLCVVAFGLTYLIRQSYSGEKIRC